MHVAAEFKYSYPTIRALRRANRNALVAVDDAGMTRCTAERRGPEFGIAAKSSSRTPPRLARRSAPGIGLPLHLAARYGSFDAIRIIADAHAQARERGTATGDSRCTPRWRRDGRRM